jgi:hypothetical protein
MLRLLTRENVKLGVVAVACLLIAWTGPAAARTVADFAKNSDKVDGKHAVGAGVSPAKAKNKLVAHNNQGQLPDKFVAKPAQIVTTHGSAAWTPNAGVTPADFEIYTFQTRTSAGIVHMPLHAPQSASSATYGLAKVAICYRAGGGGLITNTSIAIQDAADADPAVYADDPTDRTSTTRTCYTHPVNKRVNYGANVVLQTAGPGTVSLTSVRAYWSLSSSTIAPRGAKSLPGSGN